MTSRKAADDGLSSTDPPTTGLEPSGLVPIVVSPGMDTLPRIESPNLVAERYQLSLQKKRLERKLEEIDSILKKRTGERQVGDFLVDVSSHTVERVDTAAVREMLGADCPVLQSVSVRLTVVPA